MLLLTVYLHLPFSLSHTHTLPRCFRVNVVQLGTLVFDPLLGDPETIYLGTGEAWTAVDYGTELDAKFDRKVFSTLWDTWSNMLDEGVTQ